MDLNRRLDKVEEKMKMGEPELTLSIVSSQEEADKLGMELRERYGDDHRSIIIIRNQKALAEEKSKPDFIERLRGQNGGD